MEKFVTIGGKRIGVGYPAFLVAEMSANHNMDFDRAKEIIRAAMLVEERSLGGSVESSYVTTCYTDRKSVV